ncbi:MAG: hypothetical protein C4547_10620 [Phycisphaerales bacterium]|nr:MAG: hypothetical protein C4547_10620 [Phycisphaerales bacterium]
MARKDLKQRFMRLVAACVVGGSVFQVSGCDPTVRQTLLTGLEATTNSLVDTLIAAFFISLDDSEDDGQNLTTT